jgi:hypothetical protein
MASQVLLVIVVVGVIAAAIFLRYGKARHSGNSRKSASSGAISSLPTVSSPASPDEVLPANSGQAGTAAAAPSPLDSLHAPRVAARDAVPDYRQASSAAAVPGDASELEFTLESIPASAPDRPVCAPAAATGASVASAPAGDTPQALQPAEVFAKLFDLALGQARPASTVTAGHLDVAAATAAALKDAATQERYVPRRPNMLPRILSAANDDSFSRRELAALIARDPSLVGNLLKIANSSYYRVTSEPVESVERAVVMLGTNGIRSLATAALMQPIFRIGGADFPRFPEIAWEHTFRSANAAVPYNFLVEKSDPFAAELLSLVMGLAEIVVFRVTTDQYTKYPRLRPDSSVVSSLLDTHSASVARLIGASWELSEATLAGLDGQAVATTAYPTALGRSLYFGRVVGALAVLRINHVIDDETGKASIPVSDIPETQVDRMWTRLTAKLQ